MLIYLFTCSKLSGCWLLALVYSGN